MRTDAEDCTATYQLHKGHRDGLGYAEHVVARRVVMKS